jgi:heat shock protein 4
VVADKAAQEGAIGANGANGGSKDEEMTDADAAPKAEVEEAGDP